MSRQNLDADKMLHLYILDYLMKRRLHASARAFLAEGNISMDPAFIDAPQGFLLEWWSTFWDLCFARFDQKHTAAATFYHKSQQSKAREMKRQLDEEIHSTNQNQQMQRQPEEELQNTNQNQQMLIQLLLQRHAQQQQHIGGTQLDCGSAIYPISNDPLMKLNWETSNAMATNLNEDRLKLPLWKDALDDAIIQQEVADNFDQLLNPITAATTGGQATGQTFLSAPSILPESIQQIPNLNQKLAGLTQVIMNQDINSDMNAMMRSQNFVSEGSFISCHGSNQGGSNLTLKGWPLAGPDQLCSGFLQQNNLMQSPHQVVSPILLHPDSDMFLKQQVQECSQLLQQYSQHPLSSQQSESVQQQEKIGTKSMTVHDHMSSASKGNDQPELEHLMGDGSLAERVDSFLLSDTHPPEKVVEGSFKEIMHIMASLHKVECCHFSSNGKLLATAGHDKTAYLWCTELFTLKCKLEEHTEWITDVRFCPTLLRVATSSADTTVKVWDVDNPSHSLRTFTGHTTTVMSLDFHPCQPDLVFSCDNSEIRYWSIKNGNCAGGFKGGATQLRFQTLGRLLAVAVDNFISILDADTLGFRSTLQGHENLVRTICWNFSGKYLASLSDDRIKIWTVGSNGEGKCVHELKIPGNKFSTCAFHPFNPVLVIGSHETIKLWKFKEGRVSSVPAHDNIISSLAASNVSGLVASTSHDKHFKIWK